jgi:hypothetical protein
MTPTDRSKVVRLEDFAARRKENPPSEEREPLARSEALTPSQVAHRFAMLAYLRRQAASAARIVSGG